jgi:hypothetical protein
VVFGRIKADRTGEIKGRTTQVVGLSSLSVGGVSKDVESLRQLW